MPKATWMQRVLALLVGLMGGLDMLSALLPHGPLHEVLLNESLTDMLPFAVKDARWSVTLFVGLTLVILARGLWRGKRVAWLLTLMALGVVVTLRFAQEGDWEVAFGTAILIGLLLSQHRQFIRRSDPPTLRRILIQVLVAMLIITTYGLLGFHFLRAFRPLAPLLALQEFAAQLVWLDGPYAAHVHGHALWFLNSLGMLSATLLGLVVLMLLRPVLPQRVSRGDRDHAQQLVAQYGTSSIAPLALADDKVWYFGETVNGLVSYRLAHGVAVVCGDPIAAAGDVGALACEFVAFCARQDWQVCFYEVQPRHLPDYAPLDLMPVKIGEDAWIDLTTFTLTGSRMSDIRHAVNKVKRDGTTFHVIDMTHDQLLWSALQVVEADWRTASGGVELRFSIGGLPQYAAPEARYYAALAADGATVLAFCSFLPVGGMHGWALDAMRRASGCPNGTMEFLLARALEHFRDSGDAWVSLGMAPLANLDAPCNGLLERGLRAVYAHPRANAAYHYQSLFFFKQKFNPQWRGGYLLYPRTRTLPTVLTAVVRVHAPPLQPQMLVRIIREYWGRLQLPVSTETLSLS